MRTLKNFLMTMILTVVSASASAQPMSYAAIQSNARFLTDRMAYTLGVRASLLDDLYYINFDYIYGVNEYLDDIAWGYGIDEYNFVLTRRDAALHDLLSPAQYALYLTYDYFYRPIVFANNRWRFSIYTYDPRPGYFYFGLPKRYHRYHGGRFFAGIPAGAPRRPGPPPPPHRGHAAPVHHNPGHGGGPIIQPGRAGNDRGGGNHRGQNNDGNFKHGDHRGNNGSHAQAGSNNDRSNVEPGTASHGSSYTTGRGQSTSNTVSAPTTRSNQFNRESSNDRTPANANSSSRSNSTGRGVNAERVQRTRTESSRSSSSNTRSSSSSSSGRSGSFSSGRGGKR